ncbi:Plant peroxidase [Macleaya cordata]|uniref:Plant peroxidase n=1 Tax=Macleaya cordata TaxID=56857 RepID=A0A200PWC8_MACCD|nr:Plant peroxidase [Macleaya cordata]OVA13604.1 Plant peroxidase [Macleaya cordata]
MASSKNFGIRKRETIGVIKSLVDLECPGQVSCADILVLAARDAVVRSGGPLIKVPLGRRDSISSSYKLADAFLPPASTGVNDMLHIFAEKGMTIDESVAILGAHTLGISHCVNIVDRLDKRREKRTGFELSLGLKCPFGSLASNSTFVGNDLTIFFFDNQYYRQAIGGQGVMKIDADMSMDPRTAPIMERFAVDQDEFFQTFSSAFLKLSSTNVLTGNQGVVRNRCNEVD